MFPCAQSFSYLINLSGGFLYQRKIYQEPYWLAPSLDVSNMKEGDFAGLALLQRRYGLVGVKYEEGKKSLVMISAETEMPVEVERIPLSQNTVYLRAVCNFKEMVDTAAFLYSLDGKQSKPIGSKLKMS